MNSKKAELLMVSVSFVWGSSYLLMKIGLGSIAPFNLIALRFGIAFLFMTLIFLPKYRLAKRSDMVKGILMGILLFLTFSGMVYGVNRTTASAAGFLASTTVIFIPILESLIRKKLPHRLVLFSIALAGSGLYLLLSMIQFGVIAACAVICMMLFEKPALPSSPVQWAAVLCLGLFCSAYGFIAQSVAQKYTAPKALGCGTYVSCGGNPTFLLFVLLLFFLEKSFRLCDHHRTQPQKPDKIWKSHTGIGDIRQKPDMFQG